MHVNIFKCVFPFTPYVKKLWNIVLKCSLLIFFFKCAWIKIIEHSIDTQLSLNIYIYIGCFRLDIE